MSNVSIGNPAPNFTGINQNETVVSLDNYKGKKLVLYFYPKDDTPGCTAESCNLRDNYKRFLAAGYEILGVSPDTHTKHQKFIAKYELPFDLIADTEHTVAESFGVWVEKSMYGKKYMGIARTTFIIDASGIIEDIIEKVDTKAHSTQILK